MRDIYRAHSVENARTKQNLDGSLQNVSNFRANLHQQNEGPDQNATAQGSRMKDAFVRTLPKLKVAKMVKTVKEVQMQKEILDDRKRLLLDEAFEADIVNRFQLFGSNFNCPEFAPVLKQLYKFIMQADTKSNDVLEFRRNTLRNRLRNSVRETLRDDSTMETCPLDGTDADWMTEDVSNRKNVYETPFNGAQYPYALCLRTIAMIMEFVDELNIHTKNWGIRGDVTLSSVYFHRRYTHYLDYLIDNLPNVIVWPTMASFGATDLNRIRCTRFQPCGIIFTETYVDESKQSPLNFFYHDINHARRIHQNNAYYARKKEITFDELFKGMKETRNKIYRKDKPNKLAFESKHQQLIKMLLFETVHEDALPFMTDAIVNNILLPSGSCYPYESTMSDESILRSQTRRFYRQGASTLQTLYNKLRHSFFEEEKVLEVVVPEAERNAESLVQAASDILIHLDQTTDAQVLESLVSDETNAHHSVASGDPYARELKGIDLDKQYEKYREKHHKQAPGPGTVPAQSSAL